MDDLDDTRARDPAEAFDAMRRELSLLRRAVEGLTAEKEKAPDYSETLGQMDGRLRRIAHNIVLIAEHPAMRITPEIFAQEIDTAAHQARERDAAMTRQARTAFEHAATEMVQCTQSARTAAMQKQYIWRAVGIAIATTVLAMCVVPGIIARALPERWLVPERMAARVLRLDLWTAGEQMLKMADAERWQVILHAVATVRDNRDAIAICEQNSAKARKPVRCTVTIDRAQR